MIGIASTQDKVEYMKGLGFDHGVTYVGKTEQQLYEELKALAPNGVDIYYDNVGGVISNAVLRLLNPNGRVPICGQITQYQKEVFDDPPAETLQELKEKNVERGWFLVLSYFDRYQEGWNELFKWVQEGKLQVHHTIYEGIEKLPQAFFDLFAGKNIGKLTVKIN